MPTGTLQFSNHVDALGDGEARCAGINDKAADAARARRLAGAREHAVKIGDAAVGDPGLLPVKNVMIALQLGACAHRRHIRTGVRFGQGKGGNGFARGDARQVMLLDGIGAGEGDGTRAEALHGKGKVCQPVVARQRLTDQA